ncbi:uncharacterized protein METZ01_LOCUS255661, partial [marine metagenome]
KGVSIGEKSNIFIIDSEIVQNNIGVESKDMSVASIYGSSFSKNIIDLNAYKKNWQYGGGGTINLLDSSLEVLKKNIKSDKHSSIYIYDESAISTTDMDENIIRYDYENTYFKKNSIENILNLWDETFIKTEKIELDLEPKYH